MIYILYASVLATDDRPTILCHRSIIRNSLLSFSLALASQNKLAPYL